MHGIRKVHSGLEGRNSPFDVVSIDNHEVMRCHYRLKKLQDATARIFCNTAENPLCFEKDSGNDHDAMRLQEPRRKLPLITAVLEKDPEENIRINRYGRHATADLLFQIDVSLPPE
ncbi:hypothetical protein C8J32_102575 [Rhizobium sp. PP-CC-3A-592]|nr:hypothetical protein C8J32_102575 [Rhizobium sp. PP-CC-3A-592]